MCQFSQMLIKVIQCIGFSRSEGQIWHASIRLPAHIFRYIKK